MHLTNIFRWLIFKILVMRAAVLFAVAPQSISVYLCLLFLYLVFLLLLLFLFTLTSSSLYYGIPCLAILYTHLSYILFRYNMVYLYLYLYEEIHQNQNNKSVSTSLFFHQKFILQHKHACRNYVYSLHHFMRNPIVDLSH